MRSYGQDKRMSSRHVRTKRPLVLESGGLPPPTGENKKPPEQKDHKFQGQAQKLVVNCYGSW